MGQESPHELTTHLVGSTTPPPFVHRVPSLVNKGHGHLQAEHLKILTDVEFDYAHPVAPPEVGRQAVAKSMKASEKRDSPLPQIRIPLFRHNINQQEEPKYATQMLNYRRSKSTSLIDHPS